MSACKFFQLQLSAAVFGVSLLALIVLTRLFWPNDAALARYDALLIAALALQIALIAGGWETWEEAQAIFAFHVVGTVMEIFKVAVGAWIYPEPSVLKIAEVPLFTGFMYAAIGSYIARSWRHLNLTFHGFPNGWAAALLGVAIYVNFFAHHFILDSRYVLFALTILLFARTWAHGSVDGRPFRFPVLVFFAATGLLIWIAENIGTWSRIWLYPNQMAAWEPVAPAKIGSWYLLMIVSFLLVAFIHARNGGLTVRASDGRREALADQD